MMSFKDFLEAAYTYFGKKLDVPKSTGQAWERECGKYPAGFYGWALQHLKSLDSGKVFFGNPPKCVHDLWRQWLQQNPRKIERKEFACRQEHCDQGMLHVCKGRYLYAFRCGECMAVPGSIIPMMTLEELLKGGYAPETHEERAKLAAECDRSKWKQHFGGKGITGEGYEALREATKRVTEDIPF